MEPTIQHPSYQLNTWKDTIVETNRITSFYKPYLQSYVKSKTVIDWGCHIGIRSYVLSRWGAEHVYCWDPYAMCRENFKRHIESKGLSWIENTLAPLSCDVLYLSNIHNVVGTNPHAWFSDLLKNINCRTVIATWEYNLSDIKDKVFSDWENGHFWFTPDGYNYLTGEEVYISSSHRCVFEKHFTTHNTPINIIILQKD